MKEPEPAKLFNNIKPILKRAIETYLLKGKNYETRQNT